MHETLMIIQAANSQIPQQTVVALIVVSALFVFGLLILLGMFVRRANDPMAYGSFFVVALGITTVLIGFLVTFPLIISGVFEDPTQVLALLSALFGTIAGLVGTYFGVKASSDARQGLQDQLTGGQPGGEGQPGGGGAQPPGGGGGAQPPGGGAQPPGGGGGAQPPGGGAQPPGGNPQPKGRGRRRLFGG